MNTPLFKSSTGYRRMDLYFVMNIIQLETLSFCRRFLSVKDDPCGRQFDQMTQAARSGVKNLTEGSERQATSMQTALKLLDVARASLCELRDDYLTWLMDSDLVPWPQNSPEAQAVFSVRLGEAEIGDDINHDVCAHIIAERKRFSPWFGGDGATAANALLILISRALNMLQNLMERKGSEFVEEGGFSERMTTARVEAKRSAGTPAVAADAEAPTCPLCGAAMRLRNGKRGQFWGCTAYPTCRGTREVSEPIDSGRGFDCCR